MKHLTSAAFGHYCNNDYCRDCGLQWLHLNTRNTKEARRQQDAIQGARETEGQPKFYIHQIYPFIPRRRRRKKKKKKNLSLADLPFKKH